MAAIKERIPKKNPYRWLVILGSHISLLMCGGTYRSFGVFLVEWKRYFNTTSMEVSAILSVLSGSFLIAGLVTGPIILRLGCPAVSILGSFIAVCGSIASFFAPSPLFLCITMGLCKGIGMVLVCLVYNTAEVVVVHFRGVGVGLVYNSAQVVVAQHYKKGYSRANGLVSAGVGVGIMVFSPLFQTCIDYYGWRGTLLILAGIQAQAAVCGMLFWKAEKHKPVDVADIEASSSSPSTADAVEVEMAAPSSSSALLESGQSSSSSSSSTAAVVEAGKAAPSSPSSLSRSAKRSRDYQEIGECDEMVLEPLNAENEQHEATKDNADHIKEGETTQLAGDCEVGSGSNKQRTNCRQDRERCASSAESDGAGDVSNHSSNSKGNVQELVDSPASDAVHGTANSKGDCEIPQELHVFDAETEAPQHTCRLLGDDLTQLEQSQGDRKVSIQGVLKDNHCDVDGDRDVMNGPHRKSTTSNAPRRQSVFYGLAKASGWLLFRESIGFSFVMLQMVANSTCYTVVMTHFVASVVYAGIDKQAASFVITALGVASLAARVSNGWLIDKQVIKPQTLYVLAMAVFGGSTLLSRASTAYGWYIFVAVLLGMSSGVFKAILPVVLRGYVGVHNLAPAMGVAMVCQGTGDLLGPVFAGALYDASNSYDVPFYVVGCVLMGVSTLLLLEPPITRCRARRKHHALQENEKTSYV